MPNKTTFMNYFCQIFFRVFLVLLMGGVGALAENGEKPQSAASPTIQGEIPEGWEVVPDPSGECVTHVLELKNGDKREVRVPRMILRPILSGEQVDASNQASLKVSGALANQGEHLANSQSEMRSVLNRIRILLSKPSHSPLLNQ